MAAIMNRMDMGSLDSGDMSSMDHGDGSNNNSSMMMSMADMTMTFFDSIHTPLFSEAWAPKTTGQYAGTCIFLIALAVILRIMLAFRPILEVSVWGTRGSHDRNQNHHHGADKPEYRPSQYGWIAFRTELSRRWLGWRASSSAGRACYELVLAGIAYLLMIAVMTMNTGYFLSVLAGVFLGTFVLGGLAFAPGSSEEHC